MAFKAIVAICASVLFVQTVHSQCAAGYGAAPWGLAGGGWNGLAGPGLAGPGLAGAYGAGCGCGGVASTGGGFPVQSISPIAPTGVSVVSENAYEGALSAGGNLPFLSAVAIEGVLPTAGSGAVSYGCGSGAVGIAAEEGPIVTGIAPSAGIGYGAPGLAGLGYNGLGYNGLAGPYGAAGFGCGCGGIY